MKMTKRFFALLTAMVLCLAPMALMVGAAAIHETTVQPLSADYPCPKCGSVHYYVESLPAASETEYKHTADVCCTKTYSSANMKCGYCNYEGVLYGSFTRDYTHPTLIYCTQTINGVDITAYHCPACNYYRY